VGKRNVVSILAFVVCAEMTISFRSNSAVERTTFLEIYMVFGRPFVKRFAICYRTVVCLSVQSCRSDLSVCNVGVAYMVSKRLDGSI